MRRLEERKTKKMPLLHGILAYGMACNRGCMGGTSPPFSLISLIPCDSITCIRFNGYNLSLPQMMCGNRHPLRLFLRANIRNKFCSSGISSENFGVFFKISSLGVPWGRRKWQMLPPRVPGISGGGPGTRSESLQHLHAENCTLVRFPLRKCRNEGRRKGGKPSKILTRHCTSKK